MSWLSGAITGATSNATHKQAASASTAAPAFFDYISDGVLILDRNGLVKQANSKALEVLHGRIAEFAGRDFWDVVPEEVAEKHQGETDEALREHGEHEFVVHDRFADTRLEYTVRKYPEGYVVNLKDVAETYQLEKLLDGSDRYNQLVFDANPNAMWLFDTATLRVLSANQAAVVFYGIAHEQFLKLSMGALFPDGEGAVLINSLASKKGIRDAPPDTQLCKQQKGDGTLVLVELACGYVSWQGRNAVLVSISDVTERHLADRGLRRDNSDLEEQLVNVNAELLNANRDMAAFTHALSNDLQAPLHVTNGFAAMLAEKYGAVLGQAGLHYVSRIQASTRQLATLVDDLRTLVQLPQASRSLEPVDLTPLCQKLLEDLRKREPVRQVTVEMEGSLMLRCDPRLMATALSCLIGNAWKFTIRKPEAWIRIGLQPGKADDNEVVLTVSDNGAGFDAVYGAKLFTAFQRLHSSADFPGHGLGLAIVKRVASLHGARAWGETTSNGGASFFMAFPNDSNDRSATSEGGQAALNR